MTNFDRLDGCLMMARCLIMMLLFPGCASVQMSSASGRPKLIGFGRVEAVTCGSGHIYRIVAPGLSFRFHAFAPGVTLGWNETKLFYPQAASEVALHSGPLAIQTRCIGINLAPGRVTAGYDRVFGIPLPKGTNVEQLISYNAENPSKTIIERKESN